MNGMKRLITGSVCLGAAILATGCNTPTFTTEPQRFSNLPPDHTEATVYYPSGDAHEAVLMMRTSGPRTVRAGQKFEYKIELYNPTQRVVLKDIVVSDYLSPQFQLASATPTWSDLNRLEPETALARELRTPNDDLDDARKTAPTLIRGHYVSAEVPHDADRVRWLVEELYPEKMVTIRIRGQAKQAGHWMSCATASYNLGACMAAKVVEPDLKLTATLDRQFILCKTDQTALCLEVTNTGSGETRDVTVTASLPEGLTCNGRQKITEQVGTLSAGETKTINKELTVHSPGRYAVHASARSAGGLTTDAAAVSLTAREADLKIETIGPEEEYVGLPIEYEIRIHNVGNAPARNVVIEDQVPNRTEFVDATHNGTLETDIVRWRIEELPPGKYIPVTVRLRATDKGNVRNVVTARSECATDVTSVARTRLEGVATMVVEVVDTQDPIRVGNDEVYEIRVHNQGSAPETDVLVACELPEGQEFISASGPTDPRSGPGAQQVIFKPVARLAADETATWKVRVRGTEPGDMRFRVTVDSDQHGRPVRETEATRVFQ